MGSGRARPSWFFLPWNATTAHSPSRVGRQGRTCVHWPVSLNVSGAACAVVPGQAVGDGGLPGGHPPSPWVCPQGPYIFLVYAAYNGEVSPGTQAAAGVGCGWGWVGLTCRGLCTQPVGVGEGSQPCPCPILQVRSALRRMTEKKAAEAFTVGRPGGQGAGGPTSGRDPSGDAPSFQARSSPTGPGFHSRPSCPWEVARDDPRVLAPPQRHLALRGKTTTTLQSKCYPVPQPPQCSAQASERQGDRPRESCGCRAWGWLIKGSLPPTTPPPGSRGPWGPAQRQSLPELPSLGHAAEVWGVPEGR